MSSETGSSTKNSILLFSILIIGLSLHLFLAKLIFDNIQIISIALGIILVLLGLHFTIGRKFTLRGGITQ